MPSRYRLFGAKGNGKSEVEIDGYDSQEFMLQGASVTLGLIKEAAEFAPVPGLKQAAGIALQIMQTVQNVKDNKESWRILSDECAAFIAIVWNSYDSSPSKGDWPSMPLRSVIQDLVLTLASIQKDVQAKLDRSFTRMLAFNSADVTKIIDYRLKVREAVTKFELASQLTIVDAITHLLKGQDRIFRRLSTLNIRVDRTNTERIVGQIHDMTISDPEPEQIPEQMDPVLQASVERYMESERQFLSAKNNKKDFKTYRRATVESDDDEINSGSTEEDVQDKSDSGGWVEEDRQKRKKSGKSRRTDPYNRPPVRMENNTQAANSSMENMSSPFPGGFDASMPATYTRQEKELAPPPPQYTPDASAQPYPSPPQSHPSSPTGWPYAPNSYQSPPFAQQYPGQAYPSPMSPPFYGGPQQQQQFPGYFPPGVTPHPQMNIHPMTGLPYFVPQLYGFAQQSGSVGASYGTHTITHNMGNINNTSINNSNNNHSVNTYNGNEGHDHPTYLLTETNS